MKKNQLERGNASILVVDDAPDNLRLLMKILAKQGYEVRAAHNGELALKSVQSFLPDLILLDILMPGMDGYQVCKRLKADKRIREIPVIFLSVLDDVKDKVKGLEVGGVDYITKPFQVEEVLARINTQLTMRYLQNSLHERNARLQQEIAERKRAEEQTLNMWRRLEFLLNVSPTEIYACEPEGNFDFTFISENVQRILGYDPYEFVGNPNFWIDHIHPEDKERVLKNMARISEAGHHTDEYQFLHEDGSYRWVRDERILRRDNSGHPIEMIGSLSDITEHKQAEEALQHRNRELSLFNRVSQMFSSSLELEKVLKITLGEIQRLLDVVSTSIWLLVPETNELVCMQVTGPGSENIAHWRLAPGQGITGWVAQHGESVLVADTWADERHFKGVEEETQLTVRSMLGIPLRVQGETIGVLNVVDPRVGRFTSNDVTLLEPIAAAAATAIDNARLFTTAQQEIAERWRAEAELRAVHKELKEKNVQLQQANASKDKFFSIISHDLREPFSTLLGYIQFLNEHSETYSQEKVKQYIKRMYTSAESLYALLENLLTWSRVQRGVIEYEPEVIDLWDIADDNINLFSSKAEQKQITLIMTIQEEMLVYADPNMINTVVRNLVANALKFTETEGSVTVSAVPQDEYVVVMVSDTGQGIDADDLSQLFRIDMQYTRVGTAGEQGTGLGLCLCKELVEKNGGEIWVKSTVGKGTTFTFTLPKKPFN